MSVQVGIAGANVAAGNGTGSELQLQPGQLLSAGCHEKRTNGREAVEFSFL